jgi:hypothetical protein
MAPAARLLLSAAVAIVAWSWPGALRGQPAESCPEPNEKLQFACLLTPESDAVGTLSSIEDVDAYRIRLPDFRTRVTLQLVDNPASYRLSIADWNGDIVATSSDDGGVETARLHEATPGVYYVLVDAKLPTVDPSATYRVRTYVEIPSRPLRAEEHREGAAELAEGLASPNLESTFEGGAHTLTLKTGATDAAGTAGTYFLHQKFRFYPIARFVVDARLVAGSRAGFGVTFALNAFGRQTWFRFLVVPDERKIQLTKTTNGVTAPVVDWREEPAIRPGAVNRIMVTNVFRGYTVSVNGTPVARGEDDDVQYGDYGYFVVTWAEPASARFDNVLLAT